MSETQQLLHAFTDPTLIRFLTPGMCRIHLGNLGALHVTVIKEGIYGGVYAAYAFPVAHSDSFISLIQSAGDKDVEVGMIRDLCEFPEADAALVRAALARRYFIHYVELIHSVAEKHGLILFDVDTDKGRAEFYMRSSQDRAVDYGRSGKVIIDVDNNRYLIPDLEKLSQRERTSFQRHIYW